LVHIDQRKKYILAIGAVLLILALVYRFFPNFGRIYPSEGEIAALADELAGYRHQLKKLESLKGRTRHLEEALKKRHSNLFRADTPSLAAVEMQKIIEAIVSQNDVEISSTQVLNEQPVKDKPYIKVPIRLTFSAKIDQLKNILYEIESAPAYLKVVDAEFRSPRRGGANRRISVHLTVAGLLKPTADQNPDGQG